jgi:hypothetical protein
MLPSLCGVGILPAVKFNFESGFKVVCRLGVAVAEPNISEMIILSWVLL